MRLSNDLIRRAIAGHAPDGQLSILGVRGAVPAWQSGVQVLEPRPNVFDAYNDSLVLFGTELRAYLGSVDPGRKYTTHPLNRLGCAHLENGGPYLYRRGKHRGHPALVQAGPVRIRRDRNRNGVAEPGEPVTVETAIGLNIHAGGPELLIGPWSAGCQIIKGGWSGQPWREFYGLADRSRQPLFRYFLLDYQDLVDAL